ncbi:phenylacetate--CoA ligase family protein [Neptunitalea lumnitzerae]|uniref:AMP-binding protein n=1 Tax=Neptunitalea lumnitzerae TaxID=2965509 RepID=A0ABQ5MN94_9FLAO|nr:phenylacetate--CoA ligase family protein [Neptunitalea sp. Y10]GLB50854.1 AMP-binding protein [Neptunitalea sp. Y10]
MNFSEKLYTLGERYRNPSISEHYKFLKNSEQWSLSELEVYQLNQLKKLIKHAYETVPYYKYLWDTVSLKPSDIQTLEDLTKVPVLSKKDLLTNTEALHSTQSFKKTFLAVTSGTSGNSLKFQREESADSFNRASIKRGYSWYLVKPWEYNGYFWGFNFSKLAILKTRSLDALQNRFRLFSYEKKNLVKFSKKLQRASYIHGYSSMIYQTAKMILEENLPKPTNLKMVKGTSEKIYESYKPIVKEAFGLPIISEYGATESGIIAFECPHGNMHVNMEGVIVEKIDEKIVVTNLQLFKFPVIRYELGDYIALAADDYQCKCGMKHAVIKEVTGRVGEAVKGYKNEYPSLYFYYIFKNLSSQHKLNLTYYIEQRKKGELHFFLEESISKGEQDLLEKEIRKYFKEDVVYFIENNISYSNRNGKTKSFKSYI